MFAGTGLLSGQNVCRDRTFAGTGLLPGQNVCRDETFAVRGSRLAEMEHFPDGTLTKRGVDVKRDRTFTRIGAI